MTKAQEKQIADLGLNLDDFDGLTSKEINDKIAKAKNENEKEQIVMDKDEFTQLLEQMKKDLRNELTINAQSSPQPVTIKNSYSQIPAKKKLEIQRRAHRLVRINVTPNDPTKAQWEGEIITAGNDVIGDIRKYVKFNTTDGYFVPYIIYLAMKNKKTTVFVSSKDAKGVGFKESKNINSYTIQKLPDLTQEELDLMREAQKK